MKQSAKPISAQNPASYWAFTAPERKSYPSLDEDRDCDVVIVGAGFTGLSAAHHLQQAGRRCVVVDFQQPGWGASGRNGGMTVPRYKNTYQELADKYGLETALAMFHIAHAAVDLVQNIVAELSIECGFSRFGHIAPGVRQDGADRFEKDVKWLSQEAGDNGPRMLGPGDLAQRIGVDYYKFGFFEPRGAGINPLRFCVGLAAGLERNGVAIFGNTLVSGWKREGRKIVVTAGKRRITADRLIIATNGYSDLSPIGKKLKHKLLPILSSVIVTGSLSEDKIRDILPQSNVVTDVKRLTNYFRVVPERRLLFGGRGGASINESESSYRRLQVELVQIFPQLAGVPLEFRWSGRVAVTLDGLPHLGSFEEGVHYAMGYNGRGVALATYLGGALARVTLGERIELGPLSSSGFATIPFYGLRLPAKQIGIQYYRLLDAIGA